MPSASTYLLLAMPGKGKRPQNNGTVAWGHSSLGDAPQTDLRISYSHFEHDL